MAPYTDVASVKTAIGEARLENMLTVATAGVDTFLAERVNAALAEMDAHLSAAYAVPIDTSNLDAAEKASLDALLRVWANSITVYMSINQGAKGVPEGVKIAYDRAMSRLREIREGKGKLPYLEPAVVRRFAIVGDRENELTNSIFSVAREF